MAEAQTEVTEEQSTVFETMPGADPIEQPENLDLNFETVEEEETEPDELPTEEAEEKVESGEEEEAATEEEVLEELPDAAKAEEEEVEEPLAPEGEDIPPPKKPMVPKSRLDEVLAKQKALQKQLDEMKAAQEPAEDAPEEFDFDKGEIEYQQLVLDGESEKAAALRQQMRKAEREQIAYEMRKEMGTTVAKSAQETALATAAQEMESAFPVFDQNSESFNQELTQEVVELRDAFITQGFDVVDALSKAVNFVVKSNDIVASGEETPALANAPKKQAVADKKRKEVSRKLKAAESQPPEMPGESSSARGDQAINVNNLTEDEFNALPDATLKRLRGDLF